MEQTVPVIILWIKDHLELVLLQDDASPYTAKYTRVVHLIMGINMVFWPTIWPI